MRLLIRVLLLGLLFISCKEEINNRPVNGNDTIIKPAVSSNPVAIRGQKWDVLLIEQIDSVEFYSLKSKVNPAEEKYVSITDRKLANRMLKGTVSFADYDDNSNLIPSDSGWIITSIKPRRGSLRTFDKYNEPGFTAYYPELDILLCEVGHQLEVSYNLATGETTENTGNPEEFVTSADKSMRLNGSYDGQECNHYFIQVKEKGHYQRKIPLYDVFEKRMPKGIGICQIDDAFWESNNTLYIKERLVFPNVYYKVVLVENRRK